MGLYLGNQKVSITHPVISSLNITPTTSAQSISVSGGITGYNPINVSAVTSSIDNNIVAGNIKNGVTILGVTGSYEGITPVINSLNVTPSTTAQQITAPSGINGYSPINVSAVTSAIDANIIAENIKKDVTILGVTGSYEGSGGGGIGITREVDTNGTFVMPTSFTLTNTATDLGSYVLYYAFYQAPNLTQVDMSSLTQISRTYACASAFYQCTALNSINLTNLTTLSGQYGLQTAFFGCTSLTSVSFPSLTTISGQAAFSTTFYKCTNLSSVNLSSLTTVNADSAMVAAFRQTALTSISFPSLTTVSGFNAMASVFYSCTSLTSASFNNLQTIGTNTSTASNDNGQFTNCFYNCTSLTSITFPKLEKIYCNGNQNTKGTFTGNNTIQKMYFPKLDTITYADGIATSYQVAASNIFYNCPALTELHFAAANQTAIEASPGYSTAWGRGAGNVTIYFDL